MLTANKRLVAKVLEPYAGRFEIGNTKIYFKVRAWRHTRTLPPSRRHVVLRTWVRAEVARISPPRVVTSMRCTSCIYFP